MSFVFAACELPLPHEGHYVEVTYRVLDQTGEQINRAGMTPLESVTLNGQSSGFMSFATPEVTDSNGEFVDTPVGSCFGGDPPPNLCIDVKQDFKIKYTTASSQTIEVEISNSTTRRDCMQGVRLTSNGKTFTDGTVN